MTMASFGDSMLVAPELPRISNEVDSSNTSLKTSFTQAMLSNGGSREMSVKRSHQDVLGGEVSNDGEPRKKRKGRPRGSKNRPKQQSIVSTRGIESSMKAITIEVSKGHDIIQALVNYASSIKSAITVLSGIGVITHTSLGLPIPQAQPLILNGYYTLLDLNGTILVCSAARMESNGTFYRYVLPSRTSISVTVASPEGSIYGGVAVEKLIAGSTVTIVAIAFENPYIHNVSTVVDSDKASTSANGGGGSGIRPTSVSFIAASNFPSMPLNNNQIIADGMNVMGQPSCALY